MDKIFKALSDPTRRQLLDALREKDGQTLSELEQGLGMTRFGVMKHLKTLEDSALVTVRRSGRFKHHYLNAAPIQEVADRWIAPYAKPLARFALDLKSTLEGTRSMTERPKFILETFIKTTPDQLWSALIDADQTAKYYFGTRLKTSLDPGSPFQYFNPDGSIMLDGTVVEVEPQRRLVTTFVPQWMDDKAETNVVFEIEPMGDICKFTIIHHDVDKTDAGVKQGWARIASSLKSLLETGNPIQYPAAM